MSDENEVKVSKTKEKKESNFERNIRLLSQSGATLPTPGTAGGGMVAGAPVPTPRGGTSPYAPDTIVTRPFGSETWSGRKDYPNAQARLIDEQRLQQAKALQNVAQPAEPEMSFADYAALFGGGGGGGMAAPDYSAYRAALTDQAQQINAQIQAMYNALGEEAGANVGRIQDIYGGASTGIGDVYGSAIGNVGDAYSSAQQQAADQLARLGIEEAAPAVVNPMALSQAEAISQLEQGQAGGQAATERFGSAASGFGSQMAQVAQQQGTEMNAAILASLQNRLMDSLAAEQQGGGGGGGGGMSVRDQLALREAYNRDVLGELPLEEREFAFEQAQAAADPLNRFLASAQERVIESLFPSSGGKAAASPEELIQSEAAAYQQLRQALGLG
jgi:hypothetical protein